MSKAKEYRAHVERCKKLAANAPNPDVRREFEVLEQKWIALAEEEERRQRRS
jgi:hypothetical protein